KVQTLGKFAISLNIQAVGIRPKQTIRLLTCHLKKLRTANQTSIAISENLIDLGKIGLFNRHLRRAKHRSSTPFWRQIPSLPLRKSELSKKLPRLGIILGGKT
ncbi:hypothetical protein, partial [Hoeflea sp.]|uniref:hypothetical protein n=1 Tax=Hoeflea sp. TaxID=1940281 RepID=UPI002AFDDC57